MEGDTRASKTRTLRGWLPVDRRNESSLKFSQKFPTTLGQGLVVDLEDLVNQIVNKIGRLPNLLLVLFWLFVALPWWSLTFQGFPWELSALQLLTFWVGPWVLAVAIFAQSFTFLPLFALEIFALFLIVFEGGAPSIARLGAMAAMILMIFTFGSRDLIFPFLARHNRLWRQVPRLATNARLEARIPGSDRSLSLVMEDYSVGGLVASGATTDPALSLLRTDGADVDLTVRVRGQSATIKARVVRQTRDIEFSRIAFAFVMAEERRTFIDLVSEGAGRDRPWIASIDRIMVNSATRRAMIAIWATSVAVSFGAPACGETAMSGGSSHGLAPTASSNQGRPANSSPVKQGHVAKDRPIAVESMQAPSDAGAGGGPARATSSASAPLPTGAPQDLATSANGSTSAVPSETSAVPSEPSYASGDGDMDAIVQIDDAPQPGVVDPQTPKPDSAVVVAVPDPAANVVAAPTVASSPVHGNQAPPRPASSAPTLTPRQTAAAQAAANEQQAQAAPVPAPVPPPRVTPPTSFAPAVQAQDNGLGFCNSQAAPVSGAYTFPGGDTFSSNVQFSGNRLTATSFSAGYWTQQWSGNQTAPGFYVGTWSQTPPNSNCATVFQATFTLVDPCTLRVHHSNPNVNCGWGSSSYTATFDLKAP